MTKDSESFPLRINDYYALELSVTAIPNRHRVQMEASNGGISGADDLDIQIVPFNSKDNPERFVIDLSVELEDRPDREYAYLFRIELLGFFEYTGDLNTAEGAGQLAANAPALLFAAAREMIAAATARGPYGPVIIPAISSAHLADIVIKAATESDADQPHLKTGQSEQYE